MSENTEIPVVLEIKNLYVGYYKDLNIIQDINIKVRYNQITTILGANGVGKSTALKAIFGFLKPNAGDILLRVQVCCMFRHINLFSKVWLTFHSNPGCLRI